MYVPEIFFITCLHSQIIMSLKPLPVSPHTPRFLSISLATPKMIWFWTFLLYAQERGFIRDGCRIRVAPEFHSPNSATSFKISQQSETHKGLPGAAGPPQANPGCKKSEEEPREPNSAGCNLGSLQLGPTQPSPKQAVPQGAAFWEPCNRTFADGIKQSQQGLQLGSRLGCRIGG